MTLFEWTPGFSVEIERFDTEHKHLISIVNRLNNAMKTGATRGLISRILKELTDYTRYHFEAEEEAMRQASYAELEEHIAEHRRLFGRLTDLFAEFDSHSGRIAMNLLLFLTSWIQEHVLTFDRKYIEALIKAGIS